MSLEVPTRIFGVMLSDWREYAYKLKPNIMIALSDTPFTTPLYSQKRVTKRGTSIPAREAFAHTLCEELYGPDLEAVKPIKPLDDGVVGYSFHLTILQAGVTQYAAKYREANRSSNAKEREVRISSPPSSFAGSPVPPDTVLLLQVSLKQLPEGKPRLVTGVRSPHEMLKLIRDVGADILDADLAIAAANVGVALDFVFPLPSDQRPSEGGKRKGVGHNLYDHVYAPQYGRLSDCLAGAAESQSQFPAPPLICPCITCSPRSPTSHIHHSKVDVQSYEETDRNGYGPPCSRGYLHPLVQMSAHTMLMAHNLVVLDWILSGVRDLLLGGDGNDAHW
ncbi:tRNA-guanine transglycosylase [Pisolithus thermaeus]|nr:tRNA-guanine transglycosylase [Pisolithus thermaeus]